jgi:hypothetical protein
MSSTERRRNVRRVIHSRKLAVALAALLLASGAAVAAATAALHRTHDQAQAAARMVGPGAVSTPLDANGYRIALRLSPNRAGAAGTVAVTLSRSGAPVTGARVRIAFTMLDMRMRGAGGGLLQIAPGRYASTRAALGMGGRWGVRVDVAPPRGRPFSVRVVDLMAL